MRLPEIFFLTVAAGISGPVVAKALIQTGFGYGEQSVRESDHGSGETFSSNSKEFRAFFSGSYLSRHGLALGYIALVDKSIGTYWQDTLLYKSTEVDSKNDFFYGPTIGVKVGGLYLGASHLSISDPKIVYSVTRKPNQTLETVVEQHRLNSYGAHLSYYFPAGARLRLGPSLVYQHMTYTKKVLLAEDPHGSEIRLISQGSYMRNSIQTYVSIAWQL